MADILTTITGVAAQLSINEAMVVLQPLLLFIVGLGVYSWFIFKFYRFVARKEIFDSRIHHFETTEPGLGKKILHAIKYTLKYIFLFPLLTFFWIIVLAIILSFLSKSGDINNVLLVSMALVGIIRVMAYYSEDLSKDLSKMLPFALLGVFLVDVSYFSMNDSIQTIVQLPSLGKVIIYYLLFIIALEFTLRILYTLFSGKKDERHKEE